MDEKGARITISRRDPKDVRDRQIVVSLDGEPFATLLFGHEASRDVAPGDTVVIAPGVRHKLWASADAPLKLLCCCAPAYSHEDTVITE